MSTIKALILAAGKGTRMNSSLLKVAHVVAGKPIIRYVLDAVHGVPIHEVAVVVGHQAEQLKSLIQDPTLQYVLQAQQLGTGHAVMQADAIFNKDGSDTILVLAGDCPLIQTDTIQQLLDQHHKKQAAVSILTTVLDDAGSYGRIIRDSASQVIAIREAKECSKSALEINEINSGIYAFRSSLLFDALSKINPRNKQNEYYLTDVIQLLQEAGHPIADYCTPNAGEVLGVNTRQDLAKINQIVYQQTNEKWMTAGVTILDPASTFIDDTVEIGQDTIIHPFTCIYGNTTIGMGCKIGPHVCLEDITVRDGEIISVSDPKVTTAP